jgi:HD superfamily phosphohydrolase
MSLRTVARTFRDPVHDIISWKDEGELGRLVTALIDTPEVQRLRHVRQLGLASMVYHGAEHSRFSHSVGVAHVARRMVHHLGMDPGGLEARATLAAAILHDVGHAPFSHVMERVCGFHHEARSLEVVETPGTGVHEVLRQVDPTLPGRVSDLIGHRVQGAGAAIMSSQLDADRCDYLLRDAHMTGIGVGRYDLERILRMLESDAHGLLVQEGALESVEGYVVARYHMYRLVYFHRTVRAVESMLERLFARARALARSGDGQVLPAGEMTALLLGEPMDVEAWTSLSDHDAWMAVTGWKAHPDFVLRHLATGILQRRIFRSLDRPLPDEAAVEEDDARVARLMERLSERERYLFVVDEARDVPYRPYHPQRVEAWQSIRMVRHGTVSLLEHRSPLARALGESAYRLRRWCFDPLLSDKVRDVLEGR